MHYLAILNQVLQFLQQQHSQDRLPQESLALIARLTGWASVSLLSLIEDAGLRGEAVALRNDAIALRVEASAGPSSLPVDSTIKLSSAVADVIQRTKSTVCLAAPSPDDLGGPGMAGDVGLLVVPLKRGERVHLLLHIVGDQSEINCEEALSLAESLAGALALALQNSRLYTTLQYEVNERQLIEDRFWAATHKTETLYRVSRSLLAPRDLDAILPSVLNSIAGALRADRAVLLRCASDNPQTCTVLAGTTGSSTLPVPTVEGLMSGVLGDVIHEGWPLFLSQADVRSRMAQDTVFEDTPTAGGSIAIAPLFIHERTRGALVAMNRPDQRDFSQQDVDLLMATAAQIVAAMQYAQLFRAVAEERERLQSVVESSRDGVLLLGLDWRLLVVNKPALRLLGIVGAPEAWVDHSTWEVLRSLREHSPHVVKAAVEEMRRIRSGHDMPHEGEIKIGLRVVHWISLPVRGLVQPLGRLLVLRDVTEARLVDQFREDLTRTMVHDLRNPLTGIHAALNLLTRGASDVLSPGQRQILNIAHLSTQRMLKLVNAILDISRLETGQMPLSPSVFHLSEVMDELIALEKPLIEERQLNFINAVNANAPPVWADKELVERVLQNLLGNALKFTPNGGKVNVCAEVEPQVPDKLRISVVDSGPGIPPEIKRDLFTKFVVGPQAARGSGLGLAFCRMAVEAHGERIWVSETSESGTTFTFTLPLASITLV